MLDGDLQSLPFSTVFLSLILISSYVSVFYKKNKAGYTANTSCGRVGRSGNARFHTFQLDHHDGRTDGPTDQQTDGRTKHLIELRVRN